MKIAILTAVPKEEMFQNCTLSLDTIKVGFPHSEVHVWNALDYSERVKAKCDRVGARFHLDSPLTHAWQHAQWMEHVIWNTQGPLCIVDPDCIFWKDCEWFEFPTLLAGYFVPFMYSEMVHALCMPRLHTSFLYIKDCAQLIEAIVAKYPDCQRPVVGPFCPCDPFKPDVKFFNGQAIFWDTCATLFNMLGGTPFGQEHLECYDHIFSSSFAHIIRQHVCDKEDYDHVYELARTEPEKLRGFNAVATEYYNRMHERALSMANLPCPIL